MLKSYLYYILCYTYNAEVVSSLKVLRDRHYCRFGLVKCKMMASTQTKTKEWQSWTWPTSENDLLYNFCKVS